MKQQEHKLQVACVRWIRMQYPNVLCFAIPNGGARNATTGAMLKAEGVLSGVPDLMIAQPTVKYSGLFIEMKYGKNKTSERQNEVIDLLRNVGYKVEVIRDFETFVNVVKNYLAGQ